MKPFSLLVLSDSHGRADRVRDIVEYCRDADRILFLGDGLRDLSVLDASDEAKLLAVRGNCDGFSFLADGLPEERFFPIGAYHILMMHGHTHDVKSGWERAAAYAASRGADLLVYGHTHKAELHYLPAGTVVGEVVLDRPLHVFNPGSIGASYGGAATFGRVDLRADGIVCSCGRLKT